MSDMQKDTRHLRALERARVDRRRVLLGGLSILGGAGLLAGRARASSLVSVLRRTRDEGDRRALVLLQLGGGNDGLSTVVPYADDAYARARRKTRVPAKEVLRLDDYRGLHPNLKMMRAMYEQGWLAVVEGAGHPGPIRSHFKAMDIWHAASVDGRVGGEGWIGRLANVSWPDDRSPELMLHVGAKTPYSLYSSSRSAVAFELPEAYRWFGGRAEQRAYGNYARTAEEESEGEDESTVLDRLRGMLRDAQKSSLRVREAVASYRPQATYPNDDFGDGLRVAAALLEAKVGARVISLELDGFDTHNMQKAAHDRLMRTLDAGLGAFFRDLRGRAIEKEVVVLAFSEFGRRVSENGSAGTDHGKAAPMFVAGAGVRGGLHGRHPSLEELNDGDLAYTTDFRSVYASVVEDWFGAPAQAVLGDDYPKLPLFRES